MPEIKEINEVIDAANSKAWNIVRTNPAEALEMSFDNLKKSEELYYKKGIAWAHGNIGSSYAWLSEYDKALEHSFKAVELLDEIEEYEQEVQILYNLSIIFYFLADFNQQLHYVFASLELARKIGDRSGEANALNGIGTVYYSSQKNEDAIKYLSEGLDIALEINDKNTLGKIYDGLGQAYLHLEEFEKARDFKNKCLEVVNELGVKQIQSFAHDGLGEIYTELKDYAKANDHYDQAIALRKELGFKGGVCESLLHKGINYFKAGDNLSSLNYFNEGLEIAQQLNSHELQYKAHECLANVYEKMGNMDQFVQHFKAFHDQRQKYNNEKEDKKIKAFELKGKLEQIQNEKDRLEEKNKELHKYFDDVKILSNIGNEITSTQNISSIFEILYDRINSLMDVTDIFVGICNYEKNKIQVELAINNGKRDDYFEYSLSDFDSRLPAYVVKHGTEVHINEYSKEIDNYLSKKEKHVHKASESVIVFPLVIKEIVVGVLLVGSEKKNAFSEHQFNLLKSFASYVAIAIDNASLIGEMEIKVKERTKALEQSYKNTETLNKIGQELISTLNFEDVFETLYKNVNELMDATVFGVRLLDKENNSVRYLYEYERGKRLTPLSISMDQDNNYSVLCIKKDQEIVINNHEKEYKQYVEEVMVVDGDFPHSLIFYPLRKNGKVFGAISVQSFEKNAYNDYHLNIVKTLAHYTVIAFDNSRNYEIMEEKVNARTEEIVKSYENTKLLSEIGKDITSQLSVEKIIETVYDRINRLMDAESFGIGIYKENDDKLLFPGFIESGIRLEDGVFDVNEENRLGCVCFREDREVIINDFETDHQKYVKVHLKPQVGRQVNSLIYLPIRSKERTIGVITVQSFVKNSYSDYHLNMLRSIGVYVGIALDNAALYENMEKIVQQRTEEVVSQKEEIQNAYENTRLIGQISKDISESLSIEDIISKVYENVNNLMDATCFGIGIFDERTRKIRMPGFIENGERMPEFGYNIDDERLASWCFKNKREIFIRNYFEEYTNYIKGIQAPISGKDSTSIIYIPLFSKDKIVGVLTVQSFEKSAYSEYQMDILRGLAATIGSALENALLYQNLEEKVKQRTSELVKQKEQIEKAYENTKLLSEIGKEIATELSSEDIIAKVYKNVNDLMDATIFGIAVYREDHNDLYFSGAMEKGEKLGDFTYTVDQDKIATICFREKKEIVINDWEKEFAQYVKEDYEATQGDMPESMIYIPLISKDKGIGVITVQSFDKNIYEEYHLNILRSLSVYIASALENASLYADMEDRVKARTAEIEKAYQDTRLLSQISKDIVSSLEVETIIAKVYNNINDLMDATCFGIGIYNKESRRIILPGFIENGVKLEGVYYDIDDDRLACNCFNNRQEIFTNNYFEEYHKFVKGIQAPVSGKHSASIIYLPLIVQDRPIGVITVQSYEVNAYSDYHMNILRSLATTIATAIDNAKLYENLEDKVKERTLELIQQKEIIEEKNKHITDSIRYAKRIQDATLPDEKLFRSYLEQSFVLFKPKDIVSGDFYWIEKVGDLILTAVVDCTGHGVPGAFLSLIGHNSLNQIVNELKIFKPSNILEELNRIVYKTLQNNLEVTNIKDGMDMVICALNVKTNELQFAGAYNPLYIVRNGDIQEIKGDKIAIGSGDITERKFQNHSIKLQQGDCIYMFSDGYADQFGGKKGKKFKYSQFKELLLNIHTKDMNEQHRLLNHMIEAWQGDLEQIDDICVIGFRN